MMSSKSPGIWGSTTLDARMAKAVLQAQAHNWIPAKRLLGEDGIEHYQGQLLTLANIARLRRDRGEEPRERFAPDLAAEIIACGLDHEPRPEWALSIMSMLHGDDRPGLIFQPRQELTAPAHAMASMLSLETPEGASLREKFDRARRFPQEVELRDEVPGKFRLDYSEYSLTILVTGAC